MKKLISLILVIMFLLSITQFTYATDNINSLFADVSTSDKYYSAIVNLYNRGIITGTKDGKLEPKRYLTKAEQDVLLARTFKDAEPIWNNENQKTLVTAGEFYQELLTRAGYRPYSPDGESKEPTKEQAVQAAITMYCIQNSNTITDRPITRMEAAVAISKILAYEQTLDMNKLSKQLNLQFDGSQENIAKLEQTTTELLLYVAHLPRNIIDQFNARGYSIIVGSYRINEFNIIYNTEYSALIEYDSKKIYINNIGRNTTTYSTENSTTTITTTCYANIILHEFGHFYEHYMDSAFIVSNNHIEEFDSLSTFLRDYSNTNQREYFADCFYHWFYDAKNNPVRLNSLLMAGPKTFGWFLELEAAGWPMQPIPVE